MIAVRLFLRHRFRLLLLFSGIVLVGAAWLVFTALSQTLTVSIDQTLARHWRTSYDLLVRPPGSRLPVERESEMVRVNYLASLKPGITWEQYQAIRKIPGVEVAAPMAMLGYVSLQVSAEEDAPGPGLYRHALDIQVDNGVQQDPLVRRETYTWFFPPSQVEVFRKAGLWQGPLGPDFSAFKAEGTPTSTPPKREAPMPLLSAEPVMPFYPTAFERAFRVPMLLAAVDPEAEARLVGLDQAVTAGKYLPEEMGTCRYLPHGEILLLPVMVHRRLFTRIQIHQRVERLRLPNQPLDRLVPRLAQHPRQLEDLPAQQALLDEAFSGSRDYRRLWEQAFEIDQSDFGRRVARGDCRLFPPGAPTPSVPQAVMALALPRLPGGALWPLPGVVHYRPASSGAFQAVPWQGSSADLPPDFARDFPPQPPEPFFRAPPSRSLTRVLLLPVGFYDVDRLPLARDQLTTIPLETYAPPTLPIQALDGGPVRTSRYLSPSLSPLGYLQSPPLLLTNLKAACQALLPHQPCISAIRVRVQGANHFSAEAQQRLESVAAEITRLTGLEVDIVTGSSPRQVRVALPGEGLQPDVVVAEPWVQKGVHVHIRRQTHWSDRLLGVALLALTAVYIFNLLQDTVAAEETFLAVTKATGWRSRTLFSQVFWGAVAAGWLGGGVAALLAWGVVKSAGWPVPRGALWALPWLSAGVAGVGAWVPAWQAARVAPMAFLRPPERRARVFRWGPPMVQLLLRQGTHAWGSGVVLAAVGFLLTVGVGAWVGNAGYMALTLLGRYILVHIAGYHQALLGGLAVVGGLGTADWLWAALQRERAWIGLVKAVGWRDEAVFRLWMGKGALLGLFAGVVGGMVGWGALAVLGLWGWKGALLGGATGALTPMLTALVAAYFPARRAARIPPAQVVREG